MEDLTCCAFVANTYEKDEKDEKDENE